MRKPTPLADLALGFAALTRIPVPGIPPTGEGHLGKAAWTFPIVGAMVGLLAGGVAVGAETLGFAPWLAAMLAVLAQVLVTGAFHEDGLADLADGFGGGHDRERKLAIMRDSRIGVFGVVAVVFSLALRVGALADLPDLALVPVAMLAAGAASRMAMVPVMAFGTPARTDGLGAGAGRPGGPGVVLALLLGTGGAVAALGLVVGAGAAGAALIAAGVVTGLARRQIGGYSGDVLGAIQQAAETTFLLVLTIMV